MSPHATIDHEDLGLDRGAHLLIDRALSVLPVGGSLEVHGSNPALGVHLRAWPRARGHTFAENPPHAIDALAKADGAAFIVNRGRG